MADDKIITLRFKTGSVPDMELYRELEAEKKSLGLSMPVYVKDILGQHFEGKGRMRADGGTDMCMERIREIVHGELASHSAVMIGIIEKMAGELPNGIGKTEQEKTPEREETLPEYSDYFPEGLYGVLEKFM